MATAGASVGFRPQSVAMEERGAVTLAERHRPRLEPRDAARPKAIAVKRRVLAGPGKRRHDIGEGTERPGPDVQRAANKTFRRKAAARGFQQRQAGFQREGKGAAARLHPLDALGRGRSGLDDAPHRQLFCLEGTSSSPRASSSSRTSRFGTLP